VVISLLRAAFGTTKYCTYFLKNTACTNPDCMYLHELGDETASFTKEEMAIGCVVHVARFKFWQLLPTSSHKFLLPLLQLP